MHRGNKEGKRFTCNRTKEDWSIKKPERKKKGGGKWARRIFGAIRGNNNGWGTDVKRTCSFYLKKIEINVPRIGNLHFVCAHLLNLSRMERRPGEFISSAFDCKRKGSTMRTLSVNVKGLRLSETGGWFKSFGWRITTNNRSLKNDLFSRLGDVSRLTIHVVLFFIIILSSSSSNS